MLAASSIGSLRAQDVLGATGITGAGSTFAYPLLSKWSREYRSWLARGGDFPLPNAGLDDPPASSALAYEAVGSLAGTLRVKDRAVDFGASDAPLRAEELAQLGLGQFPIAIGGVVVAVNLPGVSSGQLQLTGPLVADIFLGKITRWSDAAIAALNPTLRLPDAPIGTVHRSDGSGTTFNFTDYLAKVSPEWRRALGSGLLIAWPGGSAAKGNDGVAASVKAQPHAIGYLDYAQARQLGLSVARLQNRAGRFVAPSPESFQAAATGVDWTSVRDFDRLLTDAAAAEAYPIAATVFVLMHRTGSLTRTRAALDFFRWSFDRGAAFATELGYVPLPPPLARLVTDYWAKTF